MGKGERGGRERKRERERERDGAEVETEHPTKKITQWRMGLIMRHMKAVLKPTV